jgi:O-antigen/teichoic acid export membrane protein
MAEPPHGLLKRWSERFLRNPLLQRVLRNSGYLLSANTTAMAMSFAQSVLAARLLLPAGFGLLEVITVFASNLNRLTSFRMGELVISYVGSFSARGEHGRAAALFKAAGLTEIGSSLVAYALVVGLAPLGARFLGHDPSTASLFTLYGLVLLANLMAESSTALLQFFNQFRLIAAFTVGQGLLTLVLIAAAYVTRGSLAATAEIARGNLTMVVLAYLVGKAAGALAITVAALLQAGRHWGAAWWRAPLSRLNGRWRELGTFAFSTNVTATLNLVTRDSSSLWLSFFASPLQVGYYKVARALMNILLVPVDPLIDTTYREVAIEVAGKRWANVRYLLRSGSLLSAAWTLPTSLFLAVFGGWVIRLTYSPAYAAAYAPLLILLVGIAAVNIFYWNRSVLLPLGMPSFPTKVSLVAAILEVIGIIVLVPRLGASGMALMLTLFFLSTASVLVAKTVRELGRAARTPVPVAGD